MIPLEPPDDWGDRAWPPRLRVRLWIGTLDQRDEPAVNEWITLLETEAAVARHSSLLEVGQVWRLLIDDPEGDIPPLDIGGMWGVS